MTTAQAETNEPKQRNVWIWGCLIALVMFCLVSCCLLTVLAVPILTRIGSLEGGFPDRFLESFPWEDVLDDPSLAPYLPDDFIGIYENDEQGEDSYYDDTPAEPDASISTLTPYPDPDFPFEFSYPAGWELVEEYAENLIFADPASDTTLRVGRDWACQGCLTAADSALRYQETLEFQAEVEDFSVIDDRPYLVSSGDDAHFNAYEWVDFEGDYHWSYALLIAAEDHSIYFILEGDSPEYFIPYWELFGEIGDSFSR